MNTEQNNRKEVIQRRLVDRLNTVLRQYRQKELEWQSLHHPVAELEESAQHLRSSELATQLGDRAKEELAEIERALLRLQYGESFGVCEGCGAPIRPRRLEAVPTTRLCIACASDRESPEPPVMPETSPPVDIDDAGATSSSELPRLAKEQRLEAIRQFVREDERLDAEELAVRLDGESVVLEGAMASESQKQILVNGLTDVLGVETVIDHVAVDHQLFERSDRTESSPRGPDGGVKDRHFHGNERVSEDVREAEMRDVPFVPADRPLPHPR